MNLGRLGRCFRLSLIGVVQVAQECFLRGCSLLLRRLLPLMILLLPRWMRVQQRCLGPLIGDEVLEGFGVSEAADCFLVGVELPE